MSYTALYRKFRPADFDEVVGQDAICTALRNQLKSGRISHAYLFCGTRGTGKTSVAKIMARALNCEHPTPAGPCNSCAACRAIAKDASMNVVEIDAASNNSVEDVRAIKDQTQYPPTFGKYRVFIVDEVHMLSANAYNALLKTLEEPPSYVVFILATTDVHRLPVTILSRCQRYDFRRISAQVIQERLLILCQSEGISIEARAAAYIAKAADGAMRDALSILDECSAFMGDAAITYEGVLEILGAADVGLFYDLTECVDQKNIPGSLQILEEAIVSGRELGQFVTDYLWYLRNLLVMKASPDVEGIVDVSRENYDMMLEQSGKLTKDMLMRYIANLSELSSRLRLSPQKRVLTELELIRLSTPQMEENLDSLAERVSRMERELEKGYIPAQVHQQAEKKTPAKEERTIVLPAARYEDFLQIQRDWNRILESKGGLIASVYKEARVEAGADATLNIVFFSKMLYDMGSKSQLLSELNTCINEKYEKEYILKTLLREGQKRENTRYVTEEELRSAIHTDIVIEN